MKTTPWFPGDVKPVRVGVYQRGGGVRPFSYWNGLYWCCSAMSPKNAEDMGRRKLQSIFQAIKWRGLTEPTEKK